MLFIFNKNDKHRKAYFNSFSFLLKIVSFSPLIARHLSNAIILVWLLIFFDDFFLYFLNMFANLIFGTYSVPGCVYRVHVLTLISNRIQLKQIVCSQTLWTINHVFWTRASSFLRFDAFLLICLSFHVVNFQSMFVCQMFIYCFQLAKHNNNNHSSISSNEISELKYT